MKHKFLFVVLLVASAVATGGRRAAAAPPAGTWRLAIPASNLIILFGLEEKGGKWSGQFLGASTTKLPKLTVTDVVVIADALTLKFKLPGGDLSFDGKLPPDANGRISGSLEVEPGRMFLVRLEPSKLKKFDEFELSRETTELSTDDHAVAEAAIQLLGMAGNKGAKIEDARGWAAKALKASTEYGPRWQRSVVTRLAQALAAKKEFAPLAVEYARKLERLVDDGSGTALQMEVLESVAQVLTRAGKADEAKEIQARLVKLEEKEMADVARLAPFKPEGFAGRKGKSERAVLVELFTGAECPPCVAADVAFDALGKTYKPGEVVLLQYHLHIPAPDPLTNQDTMGRAQYYGRKLTGTPTSFVNGKLVPESFGNISAAKKRYAEFRELIEPLMEKNAEAKIQLTVNRSGSDIAIKANISDVARTGDTIRLRFVLAENHVRYAGGNGMLYHHCVVRAMPGGSRGVTLKEKSAELTAKVNLDDLRGRISEYLDEYGKGENEFPRSDRPLSLKGLRVIAFIQDDDTNEILQAAQVEVKE